MFFRTETYRLSINHLASAHAALLHWPNNNRSRPIRPSRPNSNSREAGTRAARQNRRAARTRSNQPNRPAEAASADNYSESRSKH